MDSLSCMTSPAFSSLSNRCHHFTPAFSSSIILPSFLLPFISLVNDILFRSAVVSCDVLPVHLFEAPFTFLLTGFQNGEQYRGCCIRVTHRCVSCQLLWNCSCVWKPNVEVLIRPISIPGQCHRDQINQIAFNLTPSSNADEKLVEW